MGTFVGDIQLPFLHEFSTDSVSKDVEIVKHINDIPPHIAEFRAGVRAGTLAGTLFQATGAVKTVEQLSEDVLALVDRPGAFNYVYAYHKRTGWLVFTSDAIPFKAEEGIVRTFELQLLFLPRAKYRERFRSAPVIMANDFSFVTLGANSLNNYIALPVGASYSGGDGASITRAGSEGTIRLVLGNTNSKILWDLMAQEVHVGGCVAYDDMLASSEDEWVTVHNREQESVGRFVLDNTLYRVVINPGSNNFVLYEYSGDEFVSVGTFSTGSFSFVWFTELTPDRVAVELDNGVKISLSRGKPVHIDSGSLTLSGAALPLALFQFLDSGSNTFTTSDGDEFIVTAESGGDVRSTDGDNFLMLDGERIAICSNENFSLNPTTNSMGSGKKWIWTDNIGTDFQGVAHEMVVTQNLHRELVPR